MEFILESLALETTRKCNLKCGHCMRGPSQNIDLTNEIIDTFFNNNDIKRISNIIFSGGEPTLNPEVIVYTINKIITENINVCNIAMVTNGQIFNKEIVDAFNRFNEYRNIRVKEKIIKSYSKLEFLEKLITDNTDNHARITFSTDRFHKEITNEIKKQYYEYAKGLEITEYSTKDEKIYKTGFSTIGQEFTYQLEKLDYYKERQYYTILNNIYITANGYLTSEGMGQYSDMDNINMGHVSDTTIREILYKYGTPVFNTESISFSPKLLKKKI